MVRLQCDCVSLYVEGGCRKSRVILKNLKPGYWNDARNVCEKRQKIKKVPIAMTKGLSSSLLSLEKCRGFAHSLLITILRSIKEEQWPLISPILLLLEGRKQYRKIERWCCDYWLTWLRMRSIELLALVAKARNHWWQRLAAEVPVLISPRKFPGRHTLRPIKSKRRSSPLFLLTTEDWCNANYMSF